MSAKSWVTAGIIFGSIIGGYVPVLWGGSDFSVTGILFGLFGGIAGALVGYKIFQKL